VIRWLEEFSKTTSPTDTVHCEFHGGEPFLVESCEMRDVWFFTKDKLPNVTYGATSNLVFKMQEKHIGLIEDAFGKRIATSWDPKIRFANNKQYMLWRNNVKMLLKRGITVKLNISVTQDTINIEPLVLLRWIRKLGVHEVSFERLTGNGSANKHPEIFPSNKDQDAWFLKLHQQSEKVGAREWFENDFLESIYAKFEKNYIGGGTFCRDCEEKIFTINADGSIAGCPNSAPEEQFGHISMPIKELLTNPVRLNNIICERSRNPNCYSCGVFDVCGGDCHQLTWQDGVCGAPKSLMNHLKGNRKVWTIKEIK
jgi:radical SAM protein with 4Fe4S-binding SPASM domain